MSDEQKFFLWLFILAIIGALLVIGIFGGFIYQHKVIAIKNFEATINELSDEQKCLHICGFRFPSNTYFDNYKFCVEKCDRISERKTKCESGLV